TSPAARHDGAGCDGCADVAQAADKAGLALVDGLLRDEGLAGRFGIAHHLLDPVIAMAELLLDGGLAGQQRHVRVVEAARLEVCDRLLQFLRRVEYPDRLAPGFGHGRLLPTGSSRRRRVLPS